MPAISSISMPRCEIASTELGKCKFRVLNIIFRDDFLFQNWRPSAMMVFAALFFFYFLIVSGVLYDIILEPPSMGSAYNKATGRL
jgi:hypothetical protein